MKYFYQLLANTTLSYVINMTVWFAVVFYVYLQTQAVLATSILSGLYLVSMAVTGIWFGSLVDHNKKKTIMLVSSAISLVMYIVGFVLYVQAGDEAFKHVTSLTLWLFAPLLMVGVIVGNIRGIALPTVVAFLVPEDKRDKANGLVGTATGVAFLVTSVISGFLVGHSGMYWVLILAIATTLLGMLHLFFIPINEKNMAPTENKEQKLELNKTIQVIQKVPGLLPLIIFSMINNFLGGVFMSLMDAYGLSLVSVQVWGVLWGILSCAFIVGGLIITKFGLGKNPVWALFTANIVIWIITCFFTIYPSIMLLIIGMFIYLAVIPYIEAAEHTIFQKVVPAERLGRVFGFAQSVEQSASPITSFAIGPITQFFFIPFMTDGLGAQTIGSWFGTGPARGIALVFTLTGVIGLCVTLLARNSKYYHELSNRYLGKSK